MIAATPAPPGGPNAAPSYRSERAYPFCPGCGHGPVLDALDRALVRLGRDPASVVIVSDIGCSGLSDQYFETSAFHGLHGRSITYASGIKLARPELEVIVIMGDGGTGIGGAHLLAAARRNIGITVLVLNNFNFGMTGGQQSATTPPGGITASGGAGNLERPMDLCATVAVNGANLAYRGTSFDADLDARIAQGIDWPGFALLDIWDLCTAYYVPRNHLGRGSMDAMRETLGFEAGLLHQDQRPEFSAAYRGSVADLLGRPLRTAPRLDTAFASPLMGSFRLVLAGAAGARVRSAAGLLGQAAILSGLWVSQRDDFPITVKTGHSVSELVLSDRAIEFAGFERPDALLLLGPEGLAASQAYLSAMRPEDAVYALPGLDSIQTRASRWTLDPSAASQPAGRRYPALASLAALLARLDLLPLAALEAAAGLGDPRYADANRRAIEAGAAIPVSPWLAEAEELG